MADDDLRKNVTEIGGDREVALVVALLPREAGPLAVDATAAHAAADHHHRIAMAVVGPAVAVLAYRAAELGHREHHRLGHAVAQVGDQRGDAAPQIIEPA